MRGFNVARWLIWGIFAAIWTTLLLLPGKEFNRAGIEEWPANLKTLVAKGTHLMAYALFAFLSGRLQVPARIRWMPLFFIMSHATITELLQLRIEGRTGSLEDVGINQAGILLGVLAGWKWWTDPK